MHNYVTSFPILRKLEYFVVRTMEFCRKTSSKESWRSPSQTLGVNSKYLSGPSSLVYLKWKRSLWLSSNSRKRLSDKSDRPKYLQQQWLSNNGPRNCKQIFKKILKNDFTRLFCKCLREFRYEFPQSAKSV